MTKATIFWNIFDTLLTLATGGTLIFGAAYQLNAGFWVSFSIGFIGAGVVLLLIDRIWRKR